MLFTLCITEQFTPVKSYHQSNLATSYAHFKLLKIIPNFFLFLM